MNGTKGRNYIEGRCTVVCTTYNHGPYVAEALRSIADQTYRSIDVVIIDDGSVDDTIQCIQRAVHKFPFPVTLLTQANTGNVALNCNRALQQATGEYVTMFSLDDVLFPECIAEKITVLSQDARIAFVANTCHVEIDETGRPLEALYKSSLYGRQGIAAVEAEEIEYQTLATFWMQGAVVRRGILDDIGLYDDDIAGDDLIVRTKLWQHLKGDARLGFVTQDKPGFAYRKHEANFHKNVGRQVQTILDWRERYFPERPLPPVTRPFILEHGATVDEKRLKRALSIGGERQSRLAERLQKMVRAIWRPGLPSCSRTPRN